MDYYDLRYSLIFLLICLIPAAMFAATILKLYSVIKGGDDNGN